MMEITQTGMKTRLTLTLAYLFWGEDEVDLDLPFLG